MGLKLIVLAVVFAVVIVYFWPCLTKDTKIPVLEDGWWGRKKIGGNIPADDKTIRPFTVVYKDTDVKDLQERLLKTRTLADPLENVQFQYGFNTVQLKSVLEYWRTKYDWKKQVKELNKYPQFVTQIEGISVHFLHVTPKITDNKIRVLPLMLIHGWPGSIVEFYKIIPLLTTPVQGRDYVFEVICPSIPGYGFSEAPHQTGFNVGDAARIFVKLMDRLKYKKFYVQGGDWGSAIATAMSAVYSESITGVHINMAASRFGIKGTIKFLLAAVYPSIILDTKDHKKLFPIIDKFKMLLRETGYMHIQSTKPDTIGTALTDSPAGLAAYILEKFSTWTDPTNIDQPDGGLTKKFNLDELLTNVMVYWITNSITSSVRFYKENFSERTNALGLHSVPVNVPMGYAAFPNELLVYPRTFLEYQFRNIVQYTDMPTGGHFAAMEEPKLLADDIWSFVNLVENKPSPNK